MTHGDYRSIRMCLLFTWANNDDEINQATAFQAKKTQEQNNQQETFCAASKCQLIGSHLSPNIDVLRLIEIIQHGFHSAGT